MSRNESDDMMSSIDVPISPDDAQKSMSYLQAGKETEVKKKLMSSKQTRLCAAETGKERTTEQRSGKKGESG